MSDPFLSEIKIFAFGFPPKNWAQCNGQTMPINQNQALFSLLGTTYGGNGTTTFSLPNLQGRIGLHWGEGFSLGQAGGEQAHSLQFSEIPPHVHPVTLKADSGIATLTTSPEGAVQAPVMLGQGRLNAYSSQAPDSYGPPISTGIAGGSAPHENMAPYLVLNFCIALAGIFPSQN